MCSVIITDLDDPIDRFLQLGAEDLKPRQEVDGAGDGQLADAVFTELLNSKPASIRFFVAESDKEMKRTVDGQTVLNEVAPRIWLLFGLTNQLIPNELGSKWVT
jgi:hypothetical protein